jgi:glucan phosphoethanolaminetransferase (alkaline phosphatase superfamily)
MQHFHEQKSYWSYRILESKRRIELTVDLLIYAFLAAFICLIAHFYEWDFFLPELLDFIISFLLISLCILPLVVFWYSNEEEKAQKRYEEISELIEQEEVHIPNSEIQ